MALPKMTMEIAKGYAKNAYERLHEDPTLEYQQGVMDRISKDETLMMTIDIAIRRVMKDGAKAGESQENAEVLAGTFLQGVLWLFDILSEADKREFTNARLA